MEPLPHSCDRLQKTLPMGSPIEAAFELPPLRRFQDQVVQTLDHPSIHLIAISATGSGKSRIFQEYLLRNPESKALIVFPLVALAREQQQRLLRLGIDARLGAGPESVGPPKGPGAWLISPEKLFEPRKEASHRLLNEWKPDLIIVDEAHCYWEWGRSFRPAYAQIHQIIDTYQPKRSIWLTATLPPAALHSIWKKLPEPKLKLGKFSLPAGLTLGAKEIPMFERPQALREQVLQVGTAGIVFVQTRELSRRVQRLLENWGMQSCTYHAGLSSEEKLILEVRIREESLTVVATSAFGMGMDFDHFGWCVLWQPTPSLLGLAQAAGRVGRAGKKGKAVVYWSDEDFQSLEWLVGGQADDQVGDQMGDQMGDQTSARADYLQVWNTLRSKKPLETALCRYFDGTSDTDSGVSSS